MAVTDIPARFGVWLATWAAAPGATGPWPDPVPPSLRGEVEEAALGVLRRLGGGGMPDSTAAWERAAHLAWLRVAVDALASAPPDRNAAARCVDHWLRSRSAGRLRTHNLAHRVPIPEKHRLDVVQDVLVKLCDRGLPEDLLPEACPLYLEVMLAHRWIGQARGKPPPGESPPVEDPFSGSSSSGTGEVPFAGTADASADWKSLLSGVLGPVLAAALAHRAARDRPHLQRSWDQVLRLFFEGTPRSVLASEADMSIVAFWKAQQRMREALVDASWRMERAGQLSQEDGQVVRECVALLESVSAEEAAPRPERGGER